MWDEANIPTGMSIENVGLDKYLNGIEGHNLMIRCSAVGGDPAPDVKLLISESPVKTAKQSVHKAISSYIQFGLRSNRGYHTTLSVLCSVSHNHYFVTDAPDIIVNSYTYRQHDADRTVTCKPSGNPDIYTYYKWQHKSRYGELIREFVGNKTLKLPDVPVSSRYQDSGEYVCIASNGIKDKYNKFEQTGSGYLTVNALPVFTSDNIIRVKQYGEIDKAVDIMVNVYSVPKFNIFIWTYNGIHITQNSAKYEASTSPTIVKDEFHGKEEQLDGFNVTLTIHNLTYSDFANYTVTLENRFGTVKHTMTLEITGVPDTPGHFSKITSSTTSITIVWDLNSGGGHAQTFYIQYRVQGSLSWTTVSAGEEGINEQKRRRTYEVKNLQAGEPYELRMFSENTAGKRSNYTEVLIAFTDSSGTQFIFNMP
ncbi:low titin quality protein, partial [Mytilus galloprovincialis]